ncbi:hypothetical protein K438DRAFT_1998246 [Mycena galopus ATCC 62051]|nr:hypothetical protein K438DRAFT_1998246 [Mycena galopus ATCC 62051]
MPTGFHIPSGLHIPAGLTGLALPRGLVYNSKMSLFRAQEHYLAKTKLFKDLEKHREKKAKGARATNKAAAQDAAFTLKTISSEMEGLLERCGMYGVAFFTKGHIHDMTEPAILQTGGAVNFFREAVKMDPVDLHVR